MPDRLTGEALRREVERAGPWERCYVETGGGVYADAPGPASFRVIVDPPLESSGAHPVRVLTFIVQDGEPPSISDVLRALRAAFALGDGERIVDTPTDGGD